MYNGIFKSHELKKTKKTTNCGASSLWIFIIIFISSLTRKSNPRSHLLTYSSVLLCSSTQPSLIKFTVFLTVVTSFWSFTFGMQTLHPIPCSGRYGPWPSLFHLNQSSLRAPSFRGPLAALRSARFASSSFLLSSRFFLDSSALLRPVRQNKETVK